MSTQPIAGVAVWAHTGRGLMLRTEQRELVLSTWRRALPEKVIVGGAGGSPDAKSNSEYIDSAVAMANHARELGADALLCYAPARFKALSETERDDMILLYHRSLNDIGLPLILFYLYEAAGGISYSKPVLTKLLALEHVIGIKIATLDSVMTYQDIASHCTAVAPEKLVITGEDRFLGYSLMCGAQSALIGMGAAYTEMQSEFLRSYFSGNFQDFQVLNARVDRLAQATFVHPMEGYIARMSYLLAKQGIFDRVAWHDPWGPEISYAELEHLDNLAAEFDALR
jgi:4-hydroxy-tetrahydrodipicolinate synthase